MERVTISNGEGDIQWWRGWHSPNLSLLSLCQAWTWHLCRQVLHRLPAPATSPAAPSSHICVQSKRRDNNFSVLFLCNKRMTWIETTQNFLNFPKPISSSRETLLPLLFFPQNKKQRSPWCWRVWCGPHPSPHHLLPPPDLKVMGHISSSKAKDSALTLRIFLECFGRGWEFWYWGGKRGFYCVFDRYFIYVYI